MLDIVLVLAGAALILISIADVFLAVLYARIGVGLLTPRLYRATWLLLRAIARRRGPQGRKLLLSYAGPIMIVETVMVWSLLLQLGFALIYWPALGEGIQASSGPTPTDFGTAVYFSGFSFTTLGTGDIVPQSTMYRMLMILQAWIGFSVLTLTLTYLMSVYSAVVRRNTLAQTLHHLTGGTGEPVRLLAGMLLGGSEGAKGQLVPIGSQVLNLLESHHSYPILHYFRMRDDRYALTRVAYITLETATLIRTALSSDFHTLKHSSALYLFWGSGCDLLQQVGSSFLDRTQDESAEREDVRSFGAALTRLRQAGIDVSEAQLAKYRVDRQEWFPTLAAFAELMAYNLDEIIVAGAEEPCRSDGA
ncbi:potassium channel family protein [Novosphingobium sp. M1R2S20]|uniref:Potassium channel family protein n=1 Tax=Novosphingobium rhizovicinum TaxID=3228928 RepID=A0ABV3R8B4_9SPHN